MSDAPSWMPFYPSDYIADTTHLTTEGHGAYCLLLFAIWRRGGALANDEKELARIVGLPLARWKKIRAPIMAFFLISDDKLTHKRVAKELAKAEKLAERSRDNGRLGGRPKKNPLGSPKEADEKPTGLVLGSPEETQTKARAPALQLQPQSKKDSPVPNGTDGEPSLEAKVFRQGKKLLGRNAGGQITKLRRALAMDDRAVLAVLDEAETKGDAAAWVAGVLKGHAEPELDELGLPLVPYTPAMLDEEYRRMGVET